MPDGATTEQSSLASKKVWEYSSQTGSGRGDAEGRDLIFGSGEMNLVLCQSNWGKCFLEAEQSAQAQMVIEIGQQLLNPMDESAFS